MPNNALGAVLGEDHDSLRRGSGLGEAIFVAVELRLGRGVPADLGLDDHVQLGRQELDVREPTVGTIVLLQLDRGRLAQDDAGRDSLNEPTEQCRAVRQSPAEGGRHVVLVTTEQVEDGHDRSVMQDELGHAPLLPLLPRRPLSLDLPPIPLDLLFRDEPVATDLEGA